MTDVAMLQQAAEEASWLVDRGFPSAAVSDFIATHRKLDDAHRALLACNARLNAAFRHHIAREMDAEDVRKRNLAVDVASAVATVAAALAGRQLLESAAGVHGDPTWSRGTAPDDAKGAIAKIAAVLDELRPASVRWVVAAAEAPWVEAAVAGLGKRRWKSQVVVADDVAQSLSGAAFLVSSDPELLDRCATWVNVVGLAIEDLDGPRLRLNL